MWVFIEPFNFSFFSITGWGIDLDYWDVEWLSWKRTEIILSFLRLHPSTAFQTLLLTMRATPFLLRDSCPQFSSVQFSRSVMSDSLRPHESQHTRPPCPSPSPGVHSDSCMSMESVMPSSHLILGRPLLLLPPIPPSIRVFSNELTLCMRWPKY